MKVVGLGLGHSLCVLVEKWMQNGGITKKCLCKIVVLDYERGAQVLTVLHGEYLKVVYQNFGQSPT